MAVRLDDTPGESPQPPRRGRLVRRAAFAAGAFAVIAGAFVLGFSGYEKLKADDDQPQHPVIRYEGHDDPGGVYDRPLNDASTPTAAPTTEAGPVVANPAPPPSRDMPYRLIIDKIGVNAAVGTYGLGPDAIPDVPSNGREVAWYDFSSPPGAGSNTVFAGHVTWSGRGVFYDLEDLSVGDEITVVASQGGTRFTYVVKDVFLVNPDDPNSVSVMMPTPGTDQVTLITCGGDPYYVGGVARYDYTHRLIVRALHTGTFTAEPAAAGG